MLIYSICIQYLVGAPFALITASIRRGMEVISLGHCWGGMDLINEFHNLSWITEINELFHDILIYWDAPVHRQREKEKHIFWMSLLSFPYSEMWVSFGMSNNSHNLNSNMWNQINPARGMHILFL